MTKTKIRSATDGVLIPVTVDLKVQPLIASHYKYGEWRKRAQVTDGNGVPKYDNEWIYVNQGHGSYSINVNRANYCTKIYLMNTKIESVISKKPSARLQRFMDTVADTLVFEKNCKSYRVGLKMENGQMELDYVRPYWAECYSGGTLSYVGTKAYVMPWTIVQKKYGATPGVRGYQLNVDLKAAFGFE